MGGVGMGIGLIIERFLIWPIFGQLRSGVNILCWSPPATSAAGAQRRRRSVRSTEGAKRRREAPKMNCELVSVYDWGLVWSLHGLKFGSGVNILWQSHLHKAAQPRIGPEVSGCQSVWIPKWRFFFRGGFLISKWVGQGWGLIFAGF